jgi:DMSO/TMAO reductase YedYZ molybdopterin-dependent catalytic subunit
MTEHDGDARDGGANGHGPDPATPAAGRPSEEPAAGASPDAATAPGAAPATPTPAAASGVRAGDAPLPTAPDAEPAPALAAGTPAPAPAATPPAPVAPRRGWTLEPPEPVLEVPSARLAAQSRRDFILFAVGMLAVASGAWVLLPDRARRRLLPGPVHDALDTLAARAGLTPARRERLLNRALTFDDDIAEALYSKDRRVRTYDRSEVTPLRNNYNGRTPGPGIFERWALEVSGLASGETLRLTREQLLVRLPLHGQVTRFVCVEGWSAIAWWGGIRTADFLAAFPPAPGARWAALRSDVNLDGRGASDPYYVSIDLDTLRHPQTLFATHQAGMPLTLAHGAPLRLLVPVKLGLKNIKAITHVAYTADEPRDYWNERGYSKYDGI